jgi:MFS family permease
MNLQRERIATTAVFLANGLGIGAWAVEIPRIKEQLALSDSSLGLALFVFGLGAIVAMPLTGRLSAWLGSGRATALLGIGFLLAFPLPALAPSLLSLCLVLLGLGAINGALDVAMNGHASVIERQWPAPIMSSFHAAWSLGGLLGAAAGSAIHAAGLSVLYGLLLPDLIVAFLIVASTLLALRAGGAREAGGKGLTLPSGAVVRLAGLACLCMLVEGAIAEWATVFLHANLGTHAAAAGLGYSSFALAMAACRTIGDASVRRLGPELVITVGGLSAALGLSLVLAFPSVLTACIGFVLVGVGLANIVPVIFSAAGRATLTPAVGVSMAATAGYAGSLAGPPLIGLGAGLLSLRLALCVLVLATLIVCLFGARAVRKVAA